MEEKRKASEKLQALSIGKKKHHFLEDSQVSAARPSDRNSRKMKVKMRKLEWL